MILMPLSQCSETVGAGDAMLFGVPDPGNLARRVGRSFPRVGGGKWGS